jgi:hypothetical protein
MEGDGNVHHLFAAGQGRDEQLPLGGGEAATQTGDGKVVD